MKFFAQLVVISAMLAACSSHTKQAETTPAETEREPSATKELVVLADKYADNKVIFCDEKTAVVTSDPNKCGEATASGSPGCTEMPVYISKPLKVQKNGKNIRLVDEAGSVRHELVSTNGANFSLSIMKGTAAVMLTRVKVDANNTANYLYSCKQ